MRSGIRATALPPVAAAAVAGALLSPAVVSQADAATLRLSSPELEVAVSDEFPQVVSYSHASGATLYGRSEPLESIVLNDTEYAVDVTAEQADSDRVTYEVTFPELDGVQLNASLSVDGAVTTFAVDEITDTPEFRVGTIDLPGHDLVTVRSDQQGATVAAANLSVDRNVSGDTVEEITSETSVDDDPRGSAYAIVNTDELAAAIETNSTYDSGSGPAQRERGRIWRQAREDGDAISVGLWSGQWTYRAQDADFTEELPWSKVVITPDANDDGTVDWQDGAVAFRDIAHHPPGWEKTSDRVITHIPFNFASQATHPYLRTLDDVKRISKATDGLGQLAVLKGYGSEGHDSAHPDYGGNYNSRAGDLEDLNALLEIGDDWGADFGVHVNATESYPEANAFDEDLVNPNSTGWNWLDQSYYIDQRYDLTSGRIQDRFAQLADETHENLQFLYLDVYYSYGWKQERLAHELGELGFQIGTEWSNHFEEQALWTHWATDESYGGSTNKGLNSQIIRFIRNHQKDTWNPHPILGNAEIREFEGWTQEVDWNWFYPNIWENNLPAKFLQQEQIVDWNDGEIVFTGDIRATDDNDRTIYVGDAKVLDGDTYLLPWQTERGPEKLYHYNPDGGTTTWALSGKWANKRDLRIYELTDQGRELVDTLAVEDGSVTIDAEAGVAYVLDFRPKQAGLAGPPVKWGEGSPVDDPGFNAGDLSSWQVEGPSSSVDVEINDRGQYEAVLAGSGESAISQELTGLEPGTWAASAQIEVEPGQTRRTELSVTAGGETVGNHVERSTARNWIGADEKRGSFMQRVEVRFNVPESDDRGTLRISASDGNAAVRVDNVRVMRTDGLRPTADGENVIAFEDFEDVTQGWYPFVKGDSAGRANDPRTHLAERNEPYTQAGWNGKLVDDVIEGDWSLKSHSENAGLVYRTVPQTVRFEAGNRYRVSFDHQSGQSGYYEWITGYDSVSSGDPREVEVNATSMPEQRGTERFTEEFVAGDCGDYWVGLHKLGGGGNEADLIVDNFLVEDLGEANVQPACGTLEVAADAEKLKPGAANTVTTSYTSDESAVATGLEATLDVPENWAVEATSPSTFGEVAPGDTVETTWEVTPPADTGTGPHLLDGSVAYTLDGGPRSISDTLEIETIPAPPTSDVYASDHGWVSAENGWGPVELDTANGPSGAGDGPPLTLNGVVYDKGLGTHANARVRYFLGANCETFVADVGLDDAQPSRGSVTFAVQADGVTTASSPVMRPDTTTYQLEADIDGAEYVDLVVGDAGDGVGNDHASWGGAKFLCSGDGEGSLDDDNGDGDNDDLLPKSDLTVADVSSEDTATNGGRDNAVDGDVATLWHSAWSQVDPDEDYPHHITVDTGEQREITGLVYTPRPTGTNGMIAGYEIYVSADGETWGDAVAAGEFADGREPQRVDFEATDGRFVKLVATSSLNGAVFAAVAELDVAVG